MKWFLAEVANDFESLVRRLARAGSGVQIRSFSWPDEVKGDRTRISVQSLSMFTLRSFALSLAAQCIVIGPVCVFATGGRCVFVGLLPR